MVAIVTADFARLIRLVPKPRVTLRRRTIVQACCALAFLTTGQICAMSERPAVQAGREMVFAELPGIAPPTSSAERNRQTLTKGRSFLLTLTYTTEQDMKAIEDHYDEVFLAHGFAWLSTRSLTSWGQGTASIETNYCKNQMSGTITTNHPYAHEYIVDLRWSKTGCTAIP